jgi:polyhydroxybutyrate depolymerase
MPLIGAVCALLGACSATRTPAPAEGPLAPGDYTFGLRHDGRARRYHAHLPPAVRSRAPLPVMLAFHGGGGEAAGFEGYSGFNAIADREGFLAVFPDGTGPLRNRLLTWNAGTCCGYAVQRDVDDVGFAIAVLDDLARRTAVDPSRVYAAGHSNGGMMAYRLAAERADRIAAIVSVGGAMTLTAPFAPSRPVAILHIHSVDDPRALYDGGLGPPFPGTNQRQQHRPVQEALDRWIAHDGCATRPDTLETRHGRVATRDGGHTATKLTWSPCSSGYDVVHWKLTGAGHGWPGNERAEVRESLIGPVTTIIDAADEAWRFASRFRR